MSDATTYAPWPATKSERKTSGEHRHLIRRVPSPPGHDAPLWNAKTDGGLREFIVAYHQQRRDKGQPLPGACACETAARSRGFPGIAFPRTLIVRLHGEVRAEFVDPTLRSVKSQRDAAAEREAG